MSRERLRALGLIVDPATYRVDLDAFRRHHPVELEDGRRFCTVAAAIKGSYVRTTYVGAE